MPIPKPLSIIYKATNNKVGMVHCIYRGVTGIVSKINTVFLPLKIDLSKQTVQTLMKCRIRGFLSTKG